MTLIMTSYIEKVTRLIEKTKAIYLIIIGLIIIAPFFIISFYVHPCQDDYWYSFRAMDLGFFEAQKWWYNTWAGRFFSVAVLSLSPLVIKWFFGYKLIPVMLIVLFFFTLQLLVKELFLNTFGTKERLSITFFLVSLYLLYMPSICDAFYFSAGSLTYMLSAILMILFISLLLRYFFNECISKRGKIIYLFLLVVLQVAIIGSHEIAMVLADLFTGILFVWYIFRHKKLSIVLSVLLIVAISVSFIVVLAPGNTVRIKYVAQHYPSASEAGNIFLSGLKSLKAGAYFLLNLTINLYTLIGTIFFIPVAVKLSDTMKDRFNHFSVNPLVAIVIFLSIWILSFFPAFYSTGSRPPDRTLNFLYIFLMLGWFYLIQVTIFFFKIKLNIRMRELPGYVYLILGLVMFLILSQPNNVRTAYGDLLRGRAAEYSRELNERYETIRSCNDNEICKVKKIQSIPKTIFNYRDITPYETHWKNRFCSRYFGKKGVKLKKKNQP